MFTKTINELTIILFKDGERTEKVLKINLIQTKNGRVHGDTNTDNAIHSRQ